jgi:hypothetical protein
MSFRKPKVVVVMPAFNAAQTLRMTYAELPRDRSFESLTRRYMASPPTAGLSRRIRNEA